MFNRIENPILRGIAEWIVTLVLAILLFFVVREFLFRTARVDGTSMSPTLEHGDTVILNRLVYHIGTPKAGDIVAFPNPANPSVYFIKRVIGVPGDTVELIDGVFFVNGEQLEDDFSSELIIGRVNMGTLVVEEGYFFVLGDNRNNSQDSRFPDVGTIHASDMIGRAGIRIWPLGRLGLVK
jgi:signal peptidase I